MSRAQLPVVTSKHLRLLEVLNETAYNGRAIRKLLVRCLRALGLKVCGCVRVAYSSVGEHHGMAALGRVEKKPDGGYVTCAGLNMSLTVPRDPARFSRDQFARLIYHEVLHWKGVKHDEMTEDQRWCRGAAPAWCSDVEVVFRASKATPDKAAAKTEAKKAKLAHAREKLVNAERKLKLAETIVKRWQRRVAAAERALARVDDRDRLSSTYGKTPAPEAETPPSCRCAGLNFHPDVPCPVPGHEKAVPMRSAS